MFKFNKTKKIGITLCFLLSTLSCLACHYYYYDGHSNVPIKESLVHGIPKSSSIQATIDGHWLSVVFLENLGQVYVEVKTDTGGEVETSSINTPNGMNIYIPASGSYIVTFTLANGDIYYGEFEVTD